jgi:hypothetical protein
MFERQAKGAVCQRAVVEAAVVFNPSRMDCVLTEVLVASRFSKLTVAEIDPMSGAGQSRRFAMSAG